MPDETTQQRTERQARLSHAMGVMFLQDKVDKLEQDVSKITYPRGVHKTRSSPIALHGATITRHDQSKPRAVTGSGVNPKEEATTGRTSDAKPKTATAIRLVDASVLIFSLRSVHNWSRDGSTCVIIPLEAINTLDLLKKGDEPINLAARKATRWLEDKIAISTQDGNAMLTEPVPGIFAQKEHFRATPAQIAKVRETTLAERQSVAHDARHDFEDASGPSTATKDLFNAAEAPRYLRELLSVCLYCHSTTEANTDFAIAIAYPPAHLHDKMLESQTATTDKPSYLNRTDGRATEAWLDAYRIPFEVVQTSKTWTGEKPSSRFRGDITGGDQGIGSSEDLLGSAHGYRGPSRGKGSPTPLAGHVHNPWLV
uniref:PIN domain-containing protein n=1 Tax=Kalmanozyma brasiliensis (strain GHG001) TaxID=1365824 RepID=V5GNR0_KALBG